MTTVYLASPLGFSPEMKGYRDRIRLRLEAIGCRIVDPWEQDFGGMISEAKGITQWDDRIAALADVARRIGRTNDQAIRSCDVLLGVLDGAELDSGTACEIGFAAGLGKRCYGLRTDFRDLGDFDGLPINLQVLYFIESSGGRLFRTIADIAF
ncbi:MAG: nucleoside 2-deoxyribosyltransferase [Thermodesulfobacteriota bacterium]